MDKEKFLGVQRVAKDWAESKGYKLSESWFCEKTEEGYIGVEDEYINWDVLKDLEDRLKEIDICIISIDRNERQFEIWII